MLKDHQLKAIAPPEKPDLLAGLTEADLMTLRHEIDVKLKLDLKSMNLAEELAVQFRQGKLLLESVTKVGSDVPTNQQAQVFNTLNAMLNTIAKQMDIVYSAERLKRFEVSMLKVLEQLPKESKEKFFDMYGEFLKQQRETPASPA